MTQGPWYITPTAARELLAIRGERDTPDALAVAEADLDTIARGIVDAGKEGTTLDSGGTRYRGPRPLRLRLTIVPGERAGSLPVLVRVQPDHEQRRGPYTQSAPERQAGHDKRDRRKP